MYLYSAHPSGFKSGVDQGARFNRPFGREKCSRAGIRRDGRFAVTSLGSRDRLHRYAQAPTFVSVMVAFAGTFCSEENFDRSATVVICAAAGSGLDRPNKIRIKA